MSAENSKLHTPVQKKTTHQNWFVKIDGKVKGPFPKGMIQSFVLSGRVKLGDEVSFDKTEWSPLKQHRELIPKELLSVKTEEDKERLRMAIRRENERLHERRVEQCKTGDCAGGDRRGGKDRRAEHNQADVNTLHGHKSSSPIERRRKKQVVPFMVFMLLLAGLGGLAYYVYEADSQTSISITNCSAEAAPGVNWANCKLEGHKAAFKNLTGGHFNNVNLVAADFHGSVLKKSDFRYANLARINFSYADLSDSRLTGARLRGADLTNADLRNSDLSYTNLLGARLGGAKISNTRFDNAIWVDGRKCRAGSIGYCK